MSLQRVSKNFKLFVRHIHIINTQFSDHKVNIPVSVDDMHMRQGKPAAESLHFNCLCTGLCP